MSTERKLRTIGDTNADFIEIEVESGTFAALSKEGEDQAGREAMRDLDAAASKRGLAIIALDIFRMEKGAGIHGLKFIGYCLPYLTRTFPPSE